MTARSAAALLDRLKAVKATGPGRWIARCPAHEDRHPSLSVRELDDGRVLVHCFASCEVQSVLDAIGLTITDLFPERLGDHLPPSRDRRHMHAAREALRSLDRNALLIALAAENIAHGIELSEADRTVLIEAAGRCRATRSLCHDD